MVIGGLPLMTVGLATWIDEVTPTLSQVDAGIVVTSLTTWAGAGAVAM